jgi:hypothetical protein
MVHIDDLEKKQGEGRISLARCNNPLTEEEPVIQVCTRLISATNNTL